MTDADTQELLDQIHRENYMRMAYIAGVGKGLELADAQNMMKSDFNDAVRQGFNEWVEEYNDE